MKQIHFTTGMPRSGSSLLQNLMFQNPRFYATATSGLLPALLLVRNQWDGLEPFMAAPNDVGKLNFMRGAFQNYFANIDQPVIIDKSRAWLSYAEMAQELLGRRPKFIVTVRDVRDVLASFEKLWRKGAALRPLSQELAFGAKWATLAGRCEVWSQDSQPVGAAYNAIKDALVRGWGDAMHFVNYVDLCARPHDTLAGIYQFIGEEPFTHDPLHVKRLTQPEFDHVRRMPGLHEIREQVEAPRSDWRSVLGEELGKRYANDNFWEAPRPTMIQRMKALNPGVELSAHVATD